MNREIPHRSENIAFPFFNEPSKNVTNACADRDNECHFGFNEHPTILFFYFFIIRFFFFFFRPNNRDAFKLLILIGSFVLFV